MPEVLDIRVHPNLIEDMNHLRLLAAKKLKVSVTKISSLKILKRSIDARGRTPKYQLRVKLFFDEEKEEKPPSLSSYTILPSQAKTIVIVGSGPAGYFAALRAIEMGLKPIVVERGKDVQSRRKDLRAIQQFSKVDTDSNYCYGEGGAGTYSDGKLYTRSNKRGNVKKILQILVQHGANADILVDAHPHIGSNKLPQVVQSIRATIQHYGGEVLFNHRVIDFIVRDQSMKGVRCANGVEVMGEAFILATGHSARDIYKICRSHDIVLQFKPYAIGVRIEHPQSLVDLIQYNQSREGIQLPPASYSLNCQVNDHGVYSFCMCPGGLIVPAATSPGEMVVNGMSLSRRDSPYANAATVVTLDHNPIPGDALGGMLYQESLEHEIFDFGEGTLKAPAQRITDFMNHTVSASLNDTSYIPGIYAAPLHSLLPDWIVRNLQRAIPVFDRKMKGYYTEEAQLIGLESRTSSPVRIPRNRDTMMNADLQGLFPCGEGAGYAGGILSAALDGDRLLEAISSYIDKR